MKPNLVPISVFEGSLKNWKIALTHSWVSLLSGDLDPGRVTFSVVAEFVLLVELVEFCEIFRLCWTKVRVSWPFGKGFESVMISSISSEGLPPGKLSEFVFGAATSSRSPAVCNVMWLVGPLLDKKRSNNSFEFPSRSSWNLQFFLFHSLLQTQHSAHFFLGKEKRKSALAWVSAKWVMLKKDNPK